MRDEMTKWTEGEWSAEFSETWPFDIDVVSGSEGIANITRVAFSSAQKSIADCRAAVGFDEDAQAEVVAAIARQEANAHLLAAAPDLYGALAKSAEGWANAIELGLIPPQHMAAATVLRDEALAALSRAQGSSNVE